MTTTRRTWAGGAGVGLALAFAGLGAVLAPGCADPDGYDPAARYDLRTDPLVLKLPDADPTTLAPSGRRDAALAELPSLGGKLADPAALPDTAKADLGRALDELFGTPARPTVVGAGVPGLDLSPEHLAAGSRVYRRTCSQCHGTAGDGRGLSGVWVYPYPRDFRPGVFKTAAGPNAKPRFGDLVRLVRRGVPGTIMQPHDLIPEADAVAATAYSVHLSLRGEVEWRVTRDLLDESGDADASDVAGACRAVLAKALARWAEGQAPADEEEPLPEPDAPDHAESVRRGFAVFAEAGCAKCHQDYGRTPAFKYDAWGHAARVPDLTRGEFKWGKAAADLVARVRHGIPGTAMPGHPALSPQQARDVALFAREVGLPARLPPDVRDRVYPK